MVTEDEKAQIRDAPTLQRSIPFGFTFAVAKGRRRYACAAKLAAAAAEAGQREINLGEAPPAADTSADRRRRTIISAWPRTSTPSAGTAMATTLRCRSPTRSGAT